MRNKMSNLMTMLIIMALVFTSSITGVFAANIGVTIDGNPIVFSQTSGSPFIDNASRTQVPLRITMEAAGCDVTWDNSNKTAIIIKGDTVVKVLIGKSYILVNDNQSPIDTAAQIKDGRTYLPIRSVLEAFGASVAWNKQTSNVEVSTSANTVISADSVVYNDGSIYKGETLNGIPNNTGTMYYKNGDTYFGHWTNGSIDGYGVYTWANGDNYAGTWTMDERTGYGTYTWKDGSTYTGEWKDGEPVIEISPPSKIIAAASSTSEIKIGWSVVNNADYYYIYYSSSPSGPWYYFMDSNGDKSPQYWLGTYSSSLMGMDPSATRYFKITAVKNGVESEYSSMVSATTLASSAGSSSGIAGPLSLYSDDGYHEYLGKLTSNAYDTDSIFNEYGTYGSKYSIDSIWNQYGTYGSEYSIYSAFNPYTISPPIIVDADGNTIGRLTVNEYVIGAISPYTIKQLLIDLGL